MKNCDVVSIFVWKGVNKCFLVRKEGGSDRHFLIFFTNISRQFVHCDGSHVKTIFFSRINFIFLGNIKTCFIQFWCDTINSNRT